MHGNNNNTTMNESTRRKNDALKDCLGFLLQVRGQMEGANAVDNMMYRMVGRLVDDVLQALPQALRPTLRDRATILREGRLVTEGAATEMDAALDRIRWLLDGNKELERQVAERDKRIAILEKTVEGLRSSKPLKVVAFPRNHKRIIAP